MTLGVLWELFWNVHFCGFVGPLKSSIRSGDPLEGIEYLKCLIEDHPEVKNIPFLNRRPFRSRFVY